MRPQARGKTALSTRPTTTVLLRGQHAWNRIRASAAEQRQLWLEVGQALQYGKDKANRPEGMKFSEWVQGAFPGLDVSNDVPAAIWFASEFRGSHEKLPTGLTHPKEIRRWFNEQASTQAIPEDLQSVTPSPSVSLPQRDAEKVAKVLHRASSGDEGSATAQRHVEGMARKHGISVEQLTEAAKAGAPDTYFRFPPPVQLQLDEFRAGIHASIAQMEDAGISREAIKNIFIHLASTL